MLFNLPNLSWMHQGTWETGRRRNLNPRELRRIEEREARGKRALPLPDARGFGQPYAPLSDQAPMYIANHIRLQLRLEGFPNPPQEVVAAAVLKHGAGLTYVAPEFVWPVVEPPEQVAAPTRRSRKG